MMPVLLHGASLDHQDANFGGEKTLEGGKEIKWRYQIGKERLQNIFGLKVVEMPHTLADPVYIYKNPKARAEDLMNAFADPAIKGIFSCIGGDDTIRLLPFINYDLIRNNPKVFMGYSDTTVKLRPQKLGRHSA